MDNIFWIEGNSRKEWLMDRQKGQRRIEMSKREGYEKVVTGETGGQSIQSTEAIQAV